LTKKDFTFNWNPKCQSAFDLLKDALVFVPILVQPNFRHVFILDAGWSTCRVGAILSQKNGKNELVVVYTSKGLFLVQNKFHPMEGECYALVWGIMHFKQYLYTVTISHLKLTINLWSGWLWCQCLWIEGQMDQYILRF
jgi:hypothetical protein